MASKDIKYDKGYGVLGNMTNYIILSDLSGDAEQQYRTYLKNNGKQEYEEFLEYEKAMNKEE